MAFAVDCAVFAAEPAAVDFEPVGAPVGGCAGLEQVAVFGVGYAALAARVAALVVDPVWRYCYSAGYLQG